MRSTGRRGSFVGLVWGKRLAKVLQSTGRRGKLCGTSRGEKRSRNDAKRRSQGEALRDQYGGNDEGNDWQRRCEAQVGAGRKGKVCGTSMGETIGRGDAKHRSQGEVMWD